MNKKLLDNNYIIIPNFISSYRANKLKDEFVEYSQKNNLEGDSQIPTSSADYNYISFLELLCEKTPEVSEILEETVLPTYTYSRVYKNGSILKKHFDRDSCEISLTLHLGGDRPWLIWIKTPEGKDCSAELNPGDAMMYLGTIAEHWRDDYAGEEYVQVFLHYVRSRGKCVYTYFDTENHKRKPDNHDKKIPTDKTLEVKIKENVKKYSPILIKPASKLEDFIQVFDNVLSPENCNLILNEYQNSSEWLDTRIEDGQILKNIRNCTEISISSQHVLEQNFDIRKNLDSIVFESVKNIITNYNNLIPTCMIDIDTGYQLLRYKEGEFYTQHTDSFKEQQRSLSCSIQLNEDYEGGEFAFFNREMMIRAKPGSAIVFPSNFMYPHEIMPVISGTRYSIITWMV
jgi:predicted 2-oxoglutarate/Fe(II)-dependent dioxygenase YbiX